VSTTPGNLEFEILLLEKSGNSWNLVDAAGKFYN